MFVILINVLISLMIMNSGHVNSNTVYSSQFKVFWNIPSFMCNQYGIYISNLTNYGIYQNTDDKFLGDKISILYDPGNFPALLEGQDSKISRRNGGVPQEGDLNVHLNEFRNTLKESIPDSSFNGIGVIDFESWRPIYRQNFGDLKIYKEVSEKIEKSKHWLWPDKLIEKEAERRWESAAPPYMVETIKLAKQTYPNSQWGYYGFPYCFNNNGESDCSNEVKSENNDMKWLYSQTDVIFPSVYLREKVPSYKRKSLVSGRVQEAVRCASRVIGKTPKVYAYLRHAYADTRKQLTETDLIQSLEAVKREGANGLVLWGSSSDLNTKKKCIDFEQYLQNTLGPVIAAVNSPRYIVETIN